MCPFLYSSDVDSRVCEVLSETPLYFLWRLGDLQHKPQIFIGDPMLFIGDLSFFSEISDFHRRS